MSSAGSPSGAGLAASRWLSRPLPGTGRLGIRPVDAGLALVVAGAVELSVAVGGGPGAAPLDALAWILGALLAAPVLLRRRCRCRFCWRAPSCCSPTTPSTGATSPPRRC